MSVLSETSQIYVADAALQRLLDTLAAVAQPVVGPTGLQYRWGEHVADDTGDNITQYGLHGTCQAVLAMTAGARRYGPRCRYVPFATKGALWLTDRVASPNKPLDAAKTLKVAELLEALAASGAESSLLTTLLGRLVAGLHSATNGWNYDLRDVQSAPPNPVPTMYVLKALIAARDRVSDCDQYIDQGMQYCFDAISHTAEPQKRQAFVFLLGWIVDVFESAFGGDTKWREHLSALLASQIGDVLPISDAARVEYRIRTEGASEAHAFCTIPVGLLQLRSELYAARHGLNIGVDSERLTTHSASLVDAVSGPQGLLLRRVDSVSVAARLCQDAREQIVFQHTHAAIGGLTLAGSAGGPRLVPADALSDPRTRESLYSEAMGSVVRVLASPTGGYSSAYVDLCDVSTAGALLPPRVIKCDNSDRIEKEVTGAGLAAQWLGQRNRVNVVSQSLLPGVDRGIIVYEHANPALRPEWCRGLLEFVRRTHDTGVLTGAVDAVFGGAFGQALQNVTLRNNSFEALIGYFDSQRGNGFWREVGEAIDGLLRDGVIVESGNSLQLPFPRSFVANPTSNTQNTRAAFESVFLQPEVAFVHGDLNPRNVLMVKESETGDWYPVVIDYYRCGGPGPIAIDFARLEAGLQVKAGFGESFPMDEEAERGLVLYEEWANRRDALRGGRNTPCPDIVESRLLRISHMITRLRQCLASKVDAERASQGYFAALMLSYLGYLRPVYASVLTREQKLFALYSAAKIFERHFLDVQ